MAMPKLHNNQLITRFQDFRQKLYKCFESCSDACMDLLDALTGNTEANSIAELSLSALFPRSYNSIYKAIKESFNTTIQETDNEVEVEVVVEKPNNLIRVVSELIDQPQQRPFYLFATDTTPYPRPYAKTLAERGYIYQPNTIKGNKPISVGHCYSLFSILPEKETDGHAAWAVPLSGERVSLDKSGVDVASEQIQSILSDSLLPWHEKLCVLLGDTAYSQRSFLFEQSKHKNLVVVARVRSNRVFYQSLPVVDTSNKKPGCKKKYGARFDLGDAETWHEPDEITQTQQTTRKGRILNITIQAWHQMLMRGTKEQKMYRHPFTLIRVHVIDDTGNSVWKPMWLIVIGDQREEISLTITYQSFRQRFDIEHMLRFSKQRLLMTQFQTPDVKHEENWIRLVMLAYAQLWAAKDLASHLPRPWERYLEQNNDKIITPSVVQRDFQTIISEIGKPGHSPKPRGNSTGRMTGQTQSKRSQHPVVKKQSKSIPNKQKAA